MRKIRKNKPPIEAITQISIYGERFNAVVCPYCLHTLCLEKDAGKRNINLIPARSVDRKYPRRKQA